MEVYIIKLLALAGWMFSTEKENEGKIERYKEEKEERSAERKIKEGGKARRYLSRKTFS